MNFDVAKQFLDVFDDFLALYNTENWPNDSTDPSEIQKAYETAQFIEICVCKLHQREMLLVFLSQIDSAHKKCLTDPAHYVLRKIMRANVSVSVLDTGITLFVEMFGDKRFEDCLVSMMSEKASEDVLIESFDSNANDAMEVKCHLLLSSLSNVDNSLESLLKQENENITKTILACLTVREAKYQKQLDAIKSAVGRALCNKSSSYRWLWRLILFDKESLVKICSEHSDIFSSVVNALIDAGKVIKENIATDFYYIDITYSELVEIVKCLCIECELKEFLMHSVRLDESEKTFWDIIFSKI